MKKTRIIIAVVAAALMVMGIGYAAWSQFLPMYVSGDTSHIDVIYSDYAINYAKYLDASASLPSDKKSLCVKVKDMYPNAQCVFTARITNNGTMPVVLKSFTMVPDSNFFGTENPANFVMKIKSTSTDPDLNIDIAEFPFQWDDTKTVDVAAVRIEPGAYFDMVYTLKMDDTDNLLLQEKEFEFTLTPYFETTSQE